MPAWVSLAEQRRSFAEVDALMVFIPTTEAARETA